MCLIVYIEKENTKEYSLISNEATINEEHLGGKRGQIWSNNKQTEKELIV